MAIDATSVSVQRGQAAAPRPRRLEGRRRSRLASFGLHATLVVATVIAVSPVLWVLYNSFRTNEDILAVRDSFLANFASPLSFDNYAAVLDSNFPRWFLNSVIVAVLTTIVGVFVAATAGYALSRYKFPGRRGLLWSFLVTQMFPMAVLIVPIYAIMSSLGLIDTYASLVIAYCTVSVPFCAYLLKGYFDTIPVEIDEAGRVDGLSPFGTFWRISLPLARPGLAVTAFYSFLTAWGEVAYAVKFMISPDQYTLAVGLRTYVSQFSANWDLMTAASILITIPAVIVFYLVQRHLVGGLTAGGTKG